MALIETQELSRTYDLGGGNIVRALHSASVKIEKGEFVAIMGPSGSGKSTFMNILGCLDQATAGRCLLDNIDVEGMDRDELARVRNEKLGFVFQGFNLLPRTSALENVELPLLYRNVPVAERKRRALAVLQTMGLTGWEKHHPNQLSGGQQQRVAIARALVNNAPLILADEPTGNLDTKTSSEIMDLFVKLNEEKAITVVLVTHEHDIAAYSRRIIRFLDGRILSDEVLKKT
jgi:putative ABC transport system ATP-binding protein